MAEVNPTNLFPAAQNSLITVRKAWEDLSAESDAPRFSKRYERYWRMAKLGRSVGKLNSVKKLSLSSPSPTLGKSEGYGGAYHPFECRPINTNERKRLASFPDEFIFSSWKNGTEQIGNSVPPMMMRAVAGALAEKLFGHETMDLRLEDHGSYAELLDAAWALHLAPREPGAPTVVSLFAGCGGSSLGYSIAGYRELLAVDFDEKCAETFHLNFSCVPFLIADVRELTAKRLMAEAGLSGPGELDVLDGSPPCQGFSTAGKRNLWDPRNELYREFARLLEGMQPRAFVMENVSGMVKGKMKLAFADCTRALKAAGYRVSCRLLDAKWFLVPQKRKRLIWIGVRKDLDAEPSYLAAQARPVTVKEALAGIENLDGPLPVPGTKLANCCKNMEQGQSAAEYYGRNWGFNLFRLSWDKPAPVFTKRGGACGLVHPTLPRKCIRKEYQAIMSYPPLFRFAGNERLAREQMGNSVPPLMARAVAVHVAGLLAFTS